MRYLCLHTLHSKVLVVYLINDIGQLINGPRVWLLIVYEFEEHSG